MMKTSDTGNGSSHRRIDSGHAMRGISGAFAFHVMNPSRKATEYAAEVMLIAAMFVCAGAQALENPAAQVSDRMFEVLRIDGQSLSNVTVFSRTKTHVILSHSGGLTGLQVEGLDPATLRYLGYQTVSQEGGIEDDGWKPLRSVVRFYSSVLESRESRWYGLGAAVIFVCVVVGLYLYTSYLFWLICVRTETTPGIAVWLPFFQVIPLLRAARMSAFWPFALVALAVGAVYARSQSSHFALWFELAAFAAILVFWVTWSLKICQLRGKSALLAVALVVPGLNYFALLYLAGSK